MSGFRRSENKKVENPAAGAAGTCVVHAHVGLTTGSLPWAYAAGPSFPSFLPHNHMGPSPVPYLNVTSMN